MRLFSLFFVLVLAACLPTGLDEHLNLLLDDGIVATVVCPSPLSILDEGDCAGWNVNDTKIRLGSLTWDSSDDFIVEINQDGHVLALALGVSTITATSVRGFKASIVTTVL